LEGRFSTLDATRAPISRSNGHKSGLEEGGGIQCRPNPAATLLVCLDVVSMHVYCVKSDKLAYLITLIIIIIIFKTMFMVLSSWQSHCESSPGSFDECRTPPSGLRPKTKPDDLGCESACTGCHRLYTQHRHLLLLLSPKADTYFTVPRKVEG